MSMARHICVYVFAGAQVEPGVDSGFFYHSPLDLLICLFVLRESLSPDLDAHQFGYAGGLGSTRGPPSDLQTPFLSTTKTFWWQSLRLVPVHWRPLTTTISFLFFLNEQ